MQNIELYKVLHFVDVIDHVTIRYRQGKGMDALQAKKLLRTHAGWNDEPLPDLDGVSDDELHELLVKLRERIMATIE